MLYLKQRVFAVIITLICAGILYWTWNEASNSGVYYLKAVIFAPVGIIGGIFLFFSPQFYGRPETTGARIITLTVFGFGVLLGLGNWYLIDPGSFPF